MNSSAWQLETRLAWSPATTLLVVVCLTLLVIWVYRTELSPAGRVYRVCLALLRLVSLGIVLLMLSDLVLIRTKLAPARLAVLIDRSPSMNQADVVDSQPDSTRLAAAKKFLTNNQYLDSLAQRFDLSVAAVADDVAMLPSEGSMSLQVEALAVATGEATTRLGDAIAALAAPQATSAPVAVVAFTDGRTTAGRSLESAAAVARRRAVPLFLVGIGSSYQKPDARLDDVVADSVVFAGDLATIAATVATTNLAGKTAQIKLVDESTGTTLAEQSVSLASDNDKQRVTLAFEPAEAGLLEATLSIVAFEGEENTRNNSAVVRIRVTDKPVRVLLAAGYPSYEFRFLKVALDRDTKFETATYLQEADVGYARQDRTAIDQLPISRDQLEEFDVIVLLDLDPDLLPPLLWQNIETFVSETGGGLLLAAGPRSLPDRYNGIAPIQRLSPVDLSGTSGGVVDAGFRPQWTDIARELSNIQLAPQAAMSADIWENLPPQYWFARVFPPKPAAQVLAMHPTAQANNEARWPLVVMQYYGAGRVWYQGFDDTWRWRLGVGDVFFARYWGQTLRLLARGKMMADAAATRLVVDRGRYTAGETVRLQFHAARDLAAIVGDDNVVVSLQANGQANRQIVLNRQAVSGAHTANIDALPPGQYRAIVIQPKLDPVPEAAAFEVVAPPGEMADVTLDREALEAAAAATGGRYYDLADAGTLLSDLPNARPEVRETAPPVELWNRWWLLAALTTCLTLEWIFRKRKAML